MNKLVKYGLPLAVVIAGGAWWAWSASRPDPAQADRYRLESVERGPLTRYVSANGTLNPVKLVNVGTQVSGTVKSIHADFNQVVKQGQVLAELDPALLKAALGQSSANLANAQAQLALAKSNEARMKNLAGQEFASRLELDQAVTAREQAQAQVALAQAQVSRDQTNLNFSVIRSPVSGTVIDRQVDVGQTVAASFQTPTLFKIGQDLTHMQIDTTVAESDIGAVKLGQPVKFRVDAYPDQEYDGKVRQIRLNATTQQNVVTYDVVIDVANPDLSLLPAMTANVRIEVQTKPSVLMVPVSALRFRPSDEELARMAGQEKSDKGQGERDKAGKTAGTGRSGGKRKKGGGAAVYLLVNGALKRVPVKPGISDQQNTEILQGELKEGDQVVVGDKQSGKGGKGGVPRGRLF